MISWNVWSLRDSSSLAWSRACSRAGRRSQQRSAIAGQRRATYAVVLHHQPGEDKVDVLQRKEAALEPAEVEHVLVVGV